MVTRNCGTCFLILLSYWAFCQNELMTNPVFPQEELEQIVAPIALYPDSLLSQVLMASTYPLEVVQAERWTQQNKSLKDDALATELEKQTWDPSVKSLVNFPQVLTMMSQKLDWTQKLGDAFLAQQKDVMDTVQRLRQKAQGEGTLESTDTQVVNTEQDKIIIEYADPKVVYVPTYDPAVVYGTWPYPAYPPNYYSPPGYTSAAPWVTFTAGMAWGYAWGHCDWDNEDVDIDVDQNVDFNQNIDRDKYAERFKETGQFGDRRGTWQHNPQNRKGVAYRDQATAQKFNRLASNDSIQSREAFRGRTEQGRRELAAGGGDSFRDRPSTGQMTSRPGDGIGTRDLSRPSAGDFSSSYSSGRGSAFEGIDRGSTARTYSNRGSASRQGMARSSSSRSFGGSRGGGGRGGGRGGGGRGGGGRR